MIVGCPERSEGWGLLPPSRSPRSRLQDMWPKTNREETATPYVKLLFVGPLSRRHHFWPSDGRARAGQRADVQACAWTHQGELAAAPLLPMLARIPQCTLPSARPHRVVPCAPGSPFLLASACHAFVSRLPPSQTLHTRTCTRALRSCPALTCSYGMFMCTQGLGRFAV